LVIKHTLRNNANISIALPTTRYTVNEANGINPAGLQKKAVLEGILEKRRNVNAFIKRTGFVDAVSNIGEIYNHRINMTEAFDFEAKQLNLDAF
jgi:hypothetical protein